MVDVKILLGIIAAIGTLWKIATDMRNRWDEEIRRREKENKERTEFETEQRIAQAETKDALNNILSMLSDLKEEMKGLFVQVNNNSKEIVRVDAKASSAHKRIDWVMDVLKPILHYLKIPVKEEPKKNNDEEEQEDETEGVRF